MAVFWHVALQIQTDFIDVSEVLAASIIRVGGNKQQQQ
jgi:hypothetical protein